MLLFIDDDNVGRRFDYTGLFACFPEINRVIISGNNETALEKSVDALMACRDFEPGAIEVIKVEPTPDAADAAMVLRLMDEAGVSGENASKVFLATCDQFLIAMFRRMADRLVILGDQNSAAVAIKLNTPCMILPVSPDSKLYGHDNHASRNPTLETSAASGKKTRSKHPPGRPIIKSIWIELGSPDAPVKLSMVYQAMTKIGFSPKSSEARRRWLIRQEKAGFGFLANNLFVFNPKNLKVLP